MLQKWTTHVRKRKISEEEADDISAAVLLILLSMGNVTLPKLTVRQDVATLKD